MAAAVGAVYDAINGFRAKISGYTAVQNPGLNVQQVKAKNYWTKRLGVYVFLGVFTLIISAYYFTKRPPPRAALRKLISTESLSLSSGPYVQYRSAAHWHGWSSISYAVVFGDSWSMTGFKPQRAPPSPKNPLGNPAWPGETSSNGANWVDYLTYDFNSSLLLSLDVAIGGATVDRELVREGTPQSPAGLKSQVTHTFIPTFANNASFPWQADSSLFFIWIGINDIHDNNETTYHLFPIIMDEYADYVDLLYQHGARNFVFMTVPPMERMPIAAGDPTDYDRYIHMTTHWNQNVSDIVWNFTAAYSDATTFLFDTYSLFNDVIDNPCIRPQSCGLKETIEYCLMLSFGNKESDPSCAYTINQYLWMNPLHPTEVAHNVTAAVMAEALRAAPAYNANKEKG